MSLNVNANKGASIERIEEGTYPARIVQVIDMGLQPVEDFKTGKPKGHKPKVHITWEFPTETVEIEGEEKPRWYGRTYVLSFHEKSALTAMLASIKKKDIEDLSEILNVPCMVVVGSTSNNKAKIESCAPLPKGMKVDGLQNPMAAFDFDDPDPEILERLPNFLKEEFKQAKNYKGSQLQELLEADDDDDKNDDDDEDDNEEELPFDDE